MITILKNYPAWSYKMKLLEFFGLFLGYIAITMSISLSVCYTFCNWFFSFYRRESLDIWYISFCLIICIVPPFFQVLHSSASWLPIDFVIFRLCIMKINIFPHFCMSECLDIWYYVFLCVLFSGSSLIYFLFLSKMNEGFLRTT